MNGKIILILMFAIMFFSLVMTLFTYNWIWVGIFFASFVIFAIVIRKHYVKATEGVKNDITKNIP
jgi:membrane protein implicated in regulation of membrane protease activity